MLINDVQDLAKGSPLQGNSNWILSRKIDRKPIACSCMYINTVKGVVEEGSKVIIDDAVCELWHNLGFVCSQ